MDRYTHVLLGELAGALESLPDFDQPPRRQQQRATGTDHTRPQAAQPDVQHQTQQFGGLLGHSAAARGTQAHASHGAREHAENPAKQARNPASAAREADAPGRIRTYDRRIRSP